MSDLTMDDVVVDEIHITEYWVTPASNPRLGLAEPLHTRRGIGHPSTLSREESEALERGNAYRVLEHHLIEAGYIKGKM